MQIMLKWFYNAPKEQEKQSRDAKLHELGTPTHPYAERPAGEPQYCGEAAVEYGNCLGCRESNMLSVSSPFMVLTPIQKRDGHESCQMALVTRG